MKKLTLAEAEEEIGRRNLWLWRQKNWGKRNYSEEDADYELELTGYQAVGAAGDYWEVPNR